MDWESRTTITSTAPRPRTGPMPALFRRHSHIQCFFCQSPVLPNNIRNFKCPSCGCWNRYDANGEIISDEPAMHLEHLNSNSFAQRASRDRDRLPTIYGPGPFCHSCQTNQMLIINLLANYLPDPSSPEYQSRQEMLPAYRESLHARYPPVCDSCLPQVEEQIRLKDQMARVQALAGSLSKGKQRQRRVSGPDLEKEKKRVSKALYWWKVRGCLWASSFAISISANLSAVWNRYPFGRLGFLVPLLPLFVAISLLWTAWDPTYASFRKASLQGRDVRIHGKRTYNILQILAWGTRMFSSIILCTCWFRPDLDDLILDGRRTNYYLTAFSVELVTFAISCFVLRIHQPPAIRLVDTDSHKFDKSRSGTPNPDIRSNTPIPKSPTLTEQDVLHSLSSSSKPVISHRNPVFGLPSMKSSLIQPSLPREEAKDDEMDWTPASPENPPRRGRNANQENDSWLRPQRFFAPEKPTGLEGLFESARIQDEPMPFQGAETSGTHSLAAHLWKWAPLYTLFIALVVASITYTKLKWPHLMQWT